MSFAAPSPLLTLLRLRTSSSLPWLGRSLLDHSSPLLRLGTGLGPLPKPFIGSQFTRRNSGIVIFSGCLKAQQVEIPEMRRELQGYRTLPAEVPAIKEQLAHEPQVLESLSP